MRRSTQIVCALLVISGGVPASSEPIEQVVNQPPPGIIRVVSVGSPIHEESRYYTSETITIYVDEPIRANIFTGTIRPDEPLTPEPSKAKLKACTDYDRCALDDDGDGTFDRMTPMRGSVAFKLKKPVHFSTRRVKTDSKNSDNFRRVLLYAGATGDTLRLSYREFSEDMARAAFTEELTIPITKSFPQVIAVKDLQLRLFSIDGMGLRYELVDLGKGK